MWGCSLSGTRLLMNIQNQGGGVLTLYRLAGRKAAPPPRGREQDVRRGGSGGRGSPRRPPPASQLGPDSPATHVALPPPEPRGTHPRTRRVQSRGLWRRESVHRSLRDPEARDPASRLKDPRYPGAQRPLPEEPGVRDVSPARSWRPSFLHPVLKNLGSQIGDYLQRFPDIRAQHPNLANGLPAPRPVLFGAETPTPSRGPRNWGLPCAPAWRWFNPCS